MVEIESTEIKVYTKTPCAPCRATKARLTALGYDFEEIPVTDEIAAQLTELGYKSLPVVEVTTYYFDGDEPYMVDTMAWQGYKPDLIQSVLCD